jgi:hypothetical protein
MKVWSVLLNIDIVSETTVSPPEQLVAIDLRFFMQTDHMTL